MPPNKVLVRRSGLNDTRGDWEVADSEHTEHTLLPNVGIVEAVCSNLLFTRDQVLWMKRNGYPARDIQEQTRFSCMFLTEIEVKPGDRVVYRRINNVSDADTMFDGTRENARLVISHDDLIARVNPDGSLYPLAGNLIVHDTFPESVTKVVYSGKPVLEYFDNPGYKDFEDDLTDKVVVANMRQAAPVGDLGIAPVEAKYILDLYNEMSDFIEPANYYVTLAYMKRRHILLTL